MKEKMENLRRPLTKDDLELRVDRITEKGFSVFLYKTARTDARRLDDVFGINWQRKHYIDSKQNVVCGISIYNEETKEWITREDVGTEGFAEKEKSAYSDAFKRAGFAWGIGRELYELPFIFIKAETEKMEKGYKLKNSFYVQELTIAKCEYKEGAFKIEIGHRKGEKVEVFIK